MKFAVLALTLLAVLPVHAADDPASAANVFYTVYGGLRDERGGIPDATGRLRYSAVLTPRLNKLVAQAAVAQARLDTATKKSVKDAVPPMLEGDIFSSLFEGATAWKVGVCTATGAVARCPVALTYQDTPQPGRKAQKPASWNDVLVLAITPAGWKVDDVIYDAGFAFGNTGKLSDMLAMVVASDP